MYNININSFNIRLENNNLVVKDIANNKIMLDENYKSIDFALVDFFKYSGELLNYKK